MNETTDLSNLTEEEISKMKGKDDPFGTILDRLIENGYPEEYTHTDGDVLLLEEGNVLLVKDGIIDKGDYVEEKIIVSYNLHMHPIFVAEFTEFLISTGANYTLGESFIYDSETLEPVFESDMDICPDCRKEDNLFS